jgi:hypothetical protein
MARHTMFVPERLQPTMKTGSFRAVGCDVRRKRSHLRVRSILRRPSLLTLIRLSRLKSRLRRMARSPSVNVRGVRASGRALRRMPRGDLTS